MLKTKEEKKSRTISMPAFISSILGVTEPAIYGANPSNESPILYLMCSFRVPWYAMMGFNIPMYSAGAMGIFVFPTLIGPDGSLSKVTLAIIAIVGALCILPYPTLCTSANLYGGGAAKVEGKS